jgi:DNA segregation ATPase FtsK/SpoIIIE, S-DNA-T family
MAAGKDLARQARDVLADVLRVFAHAGRPGLHWQTLAELLAAEHPDAYAGTTAEAIRALLRGEGVSSVDVKVDGTVLKGYRRSQIDAALQRRQIAA